jgi:hypothetical protein
MTCSEFGEELSDQLSICYLREIDRGETDETISTHLPFRRIEKLVNSTGQIRQAMSSIPSSEVQMT